VAHDLFPKVAKEDPELPDRPEPQVARDFYAAMKAHSIEGVSALLDSDVVWHVPGRHSRSGTYLGRESTIGLFDNFSRAKKREIDVEDVLCGERFVMVLVRVIERSAAPNESRFVHVIRTRNGRICESWHFDEDQSRLDERLDERS